MSDVINNAERNRYELTIDGQVAYARYRREGSEVFIDYVEAPPALRGTGAAGRLMAGMMDQLKAEGDVRVTPICGYAATWLQRHKADYAGML